MGVYGGGELTPTIDGIAAEGVTFSRTVAAAPWTQPSIASLFCSYYPGVHKVQSYKIALDNYVRGSAPTMSVFSDDFVTLAEALQQNGYETAAFCANPFILPGYGFAQGFDHFDASFAENQTPGSVVNEAALAWLAERDASKPMFLYLHYMDVHGPYEGDQEWLEARLDEIERMPDKRALSEREINELRYLRQVPEWVKDKARHGRLAHYQEYWAARYDAGVRAMDKHLASLRDRLDELGLWDDAWVIVTADHGEALCEHGFWSHGYSVHHSELDVPLIMRWPSTLPAGSRVSVAARLIDVMPTLLDQLGLPPIEGIQGVSLQPYVTGETPETPCVAFAESVKVGTEQKAVYQGHLKLLMTDSQPPRWELFDVSADPAEQRNLASSDPRLGALIALLRGQMEENKTVARPGQQSRVPLSEAQRHRLESLGYLGGAEPTTRPHPTSGQAP